MSIVEVANELLDYLNVHEGNRRTYDAVEEILQMLKQDLTEEQLQKEVKRLGDIIAYLMEKEEKQFAISMPNENVKKRFSEGIERKIRESVERCDSIVEIKSKEQTPLIEEFEDDFRTRMNVELNGKKMEVRENWSRLVWDGYKSLNERIRLVVKEFTIGVMDELDVCMEMVRRRFSEAEAAGLKTSYMEMNQSVMSNYEVMQKELISEAENYKFPKERFENFNQTIGAKLQKTTNKEKKISGILKLLPLIIYGIKYVCDNYLFPKETFFDKLMSLLIEWTEKEMQKGSDAFLKVVEVALQFVQDGGEIVQLSTEFLLLFFFVGWLYYIYIKIIDKVRKKSFYRKQQAIVQSEIEPFLKELDIKSEIKSALKVMEVKTTERYMQKHRVLLEKLIEPVGEVAEKNTLQKIQYAYLEYSGSGGV